MKTSEVLGSLPLNPTYVAKFSSYSTSGQLDLKRVPYSLGRYIDETA